jgi:alpha-glucosidase
MQQKEDWQEWRVEGRAGAPQDDVPREPGFPCKISAMKWRIGLTLCFFFAGAARLSATEVQSPSGKLVLTIETVPSAANAPTGRLVYRVAYGGKALVDESALKLELEGQRTLGPEVRVIGAETSRGVETYKLIAGKTSEVRDRYNGLRMDLEQAGTLRSKFSIEARVFDDAVALRYVVPEQSAIRTLRLTKESTEFRIAKDATTYALELPNFHSMYESEFLKLPISAFANQGGVASKVLIGLPLLMEVPGVAWMAITEADLKDNSSMYLMNTSGSWLGHYFESVLAPSEEDASVIVKSSLPHHSAWRVLLVGDRPGSLVESNAITSLNPENQIADTSWIKPGKASWDWWSGSLGADGKPSYSTETMKYYVDFAAKSGFEYMLVDAGWSEPNDITKMNGKVDIPELVKYAAAKGVRIWIWLYYRSTDRQMAEAFPLYEKWGVAGLKIDFIERDDQGGIDFYYRTADLAAKYHLMVDFHGATKPSGLERPYPNVMGYEGVLGLEQSKAGGRDNPDHHTMIPFTRMLAGPTDYTPGAFRNVTREEFVPRMESPMVMGTRTHQLGMYVVYQAAIQMVADWPKAYDGEPAFEFIKAAPATWDETRVLNGRPGEFVTIARRHGKEWFLGSLTNWSARELELPLDFLGSGNFTAEIYADAPEADLQPTKVRIERKIVDHTTHLTARLASGGGYAVRFVPKL